MVVGSLLANSLSHLFPNSSPVTRPATFPVSGPGFPVWHLFMHGVGFWCCPIHLVQEKVDPQLPGNNHQSTCQDLSYQFATANFRTEFSRKCPKQDYPSRLLLPFRALNRGRLSTGSCKRFSLADRSLRRQQWFSAGEANAITRYIGRGILV